MGLDGLLTDWPIDRIDQIDWLAAWLWTVWLTDSPSDAARQADEPVPDEVLLFSCFFEEDLERRDTWPGKKSLTRMFNKKTALRRKGV